MSTNGDTALPPLAGPSLSWAFSSDSKSTDEGGAPTAATTAVPATASGLPPPRPPTPSERTESEMELAIATGAGREQMPSPHLDAIADHVYLSNHDSATNRELLEAHGITHILTVGIDMDQPFAEENIIYETIVEYDDEGTKRTLSATFDDFMLRGCDVRALRREIEALVVKTILPIQPHLAHTESSSAAAVCASLASPSRCSPSCEAARRRMPSCCASTKAA